jgi:hypothetical protein
VVSGRSGRPPGPVAPRRARQLKIAPPVGALASGIANLQQRHAYPILLSPLDCLPSRRIGEVLAATEKAAYLCAVQRFKIAREDQAELRVEQARE